MKKPLLLAVMLLCSFAGSAQAQLWYGFPSVAPFYWTPPYYVWPYWYYQPEVIAPRPRWTSAELDQFKQDNLEAKNNYEKSLSEYRQEKQSRLEESAALKKRLADYHNQGVLPPSSIVISGRKYSSYAAFKRSPDYRQWKQYQIARHHWDAEKRQIDHNYNERLVRQGLKNLNEWEKLDFGEKRITKARKQVEAYMGHPGPYLQEPVYVNQKDPVVPPWPEQVQEEEFNAEDAR